MNNNRFKFRLWTGKRFRYDDFFIQDGTTHEMTDYDGARKLDGVLQQNTDLLDKNGKEIYEGDIVTGKNINKSKVIFHDGKFVTADSNDEAYFIDVCNVISINIVGNMFENPDLLYKK